jgi:hypothetical protein
MTAACTPNGAAMRFVPGSGIILQSSVLPPTFARRARQCLPRAAPLGGASLYPHPFKFDFMVLRAIRFEPIMVARSFSAASVKQKNPRRGEQPRGGVL